MVDYVERLEQEAAQMRRIRREAGERIAAARAEKEAAAADEAERRAEARQARDAAALAAVTRELKSGYMAEPGSTEEGFKKALPDLLEQRRRTAALEGDQAARAAFSRQYQG